MNVNLSLIVLHLDLTSATSGVLLDEGNVPSRPLTDSNIGNGLRDLLLEYLELHPEWVKFILIDVVYDTQNITIIYGCLIPTVINNLKGQWVSPGEINAVDLKKLVFQASQKVIAF